LAGVTLSSASRADEGSVSLTIYKAGWIIGGSGARRRVELPVGGDTGSQPAG